MVVCIVVTNGFSFVNLNLSDHNLTDLRQETFPFVPLRTYTKNEKKKKGHFISCSVSIAIPPNNGGSIGVDGAEIEYRCCGNGIGTVCSIFFFSSRFFMDFFFFIYSKGSVVAGRRIRSSNRVLARAIRWVRLSSDEERFSVLFFNRNRCNFIFSDSNSAHSSYIIILSGQCAKGVMGLRDNTRCRV